MAAAGAPGEDARNRLTKAANMAKLQLSRRQESRIFRKAAAGAPGRDAADNGHEYGQASAEPAVWIQDLQEGAAGAPGEDARNRPTMATNMAKLQLSRRQESRIFRKAAAGAPGEDARNRLTKAASMAKLQLSRRQESRIFRKAQPERRGEMPGPGRQRPQIWPSFS